MKAPVVVLAVGNDSRGDDAIGPLLAARFAAELRESGWAADFEVMEEYQLQIEHATDLEGRALALFIDAGVGTPAPYRFRGIQPSGNAGFTTHALAPEVLLQVFRQAMGEAPPPAFVLCVRGESFELGEGLSPVAQANLKAALEMLRCLARCPRAEAWAKLSDSA